MWEDAQVNVQSEPDFLSDYIFFAQSVLLRSCPSGTLDNSIMTQDLIHLLEVAQ